MAVQRKKALRKTPLTRFRDRIERRFADLKAAAEEQGKATAWAAFDDPDDRTGFAKAHALKTEARILEDLCDIVRQELDAVT